MCSRDDTPPYDETEIAEAVNQAYNDPIDGFDAYTQNKEVVAEFPIGVPRYKTLTDEAMQIISDEAEQYINPETVTFPAWTGWSKEKADRLQAERLQPKPNFWPHPEMSPNFYIYPGLEWMLKGWLKDFLQQNQDYQATMEDDSFLYLIEEARILFQKLS